MLWVCAEVSVKFVTEISCFWCTDCRKAVKDILCLYIGTLNHHGRYQNLKVTYFQCSVVFSVRCCRFVRGFITTFVLFPYYRLPTPVPAGTGFGLTPAYLYKPPVACRGSNIFYDLTIY